MDEIGACADADFEHSLAVVARELRERVDERLIAIAEAFDFLEIGGQLYPCIACGVRGCVAAVEVLWKWTFGCVVKQVFVFRVVRVVYAKRLSAASCAAARLRTAFDYPPAIVTPPSATMTWPVM